MRPGLLPVVDDEDGVGSAAGRFAAGGRGLRCDQENLRPGKYGMYILLYAILPIQQSQEMRIRQDKPPDPDDRQMILRGDPAHNPAQKTVESMGLSGSSLSGNSRTHAEILKVRMREITEILKYILWVSRRTY